MTHSSFPLGPSPTSSLSLPPPILGSAPLSSPVGIGTEGSSVEASWSHEETRSCWARFCAWVSRFIGRLFSCCGCGTPSIRDEEETEEIGSFGLREFYDNMIDAELSLIAPDRDRALEFTLEEEDTYWIWCHPVTQIVSIEKDEGANRCELIRLRPIGEDDVKCYRSAEALPLSNEEKAILDALLGHVQRIKEEREGLRERANRFNPTCLSLLFSVVRGDRAKRSHNYVVGYQKWEMSFEIPRIECEGNETFRVFERIQPGEDWLTFQENFEYTRSSQSKKLCISLDAEGEIRHVYIDWDCLSEERFNAAVYDPHSAWNKRLTAIINQFLFQKGFGIEGSLGGKYNTIVVHPLAIEQVPELILSKLINRGELDNLAGYGRVKFLRDAFVEEPGIDVGGFKREFLRLLTRSLLDGNPSRTIAMSGGIPTLEDNGAIPMLQRLGSLFSVCQSCDLLITGRLLPDRYFELLCYLARLEVDHTLDEAQMVEAAIALLTGDGNIPDWIVPCIRGAQPLNDDQKEYLNILLCLEVHEGDYAQDLRRWLLERYQKQVNAAWYIVQGMTPTTREAFCSQSPQALSNQVQGLD